MKISLLVYGVLVFLGQLTCSTGQAGQNACLQIYSVPKQTVVCEPSEDVRTQLSQLENDVKSQGEQLIDIDTRIDHLDPEKPQQLPEDVMTKLAEIDSLQLTQVNQSTMLLRLSEGVHSLTSTVADLESASSREFSELVSAQTELISAMWHHSNKSMHTEYMDSLNDTVSHFLVQLHLLELKLTDSILTKESQLVTQISDAATRNRLESEAAHQRHTERMLEYSAELALEREARLEHWNITDKHASNLEGLSLRLENLELKLSVVQEHQTQSNNNIQTIMDSLKSSEEKLASLQVNNTDMKHDLDVCRSHTASIGDEMTSIKARLERWEHLTPRTLVVKDCQEALRYYHPVSGVYTINPSPALQPLDVFCHMQDDVGWTVVQRRQNGSVEFFRGWQDYVKGFGDAAGEYWIGLEALHTLTTSGPYGLRVDLQDWRGKWWYADYSSFAVDPESHNYTLHVSGYQGNAGDSLSYHDNMPFTTMDKNNDQKDGLCATWCHGAWWYKDCFLSNLNGRYYQQGPYVPATNWGDGVNWKTTFNTYYYSFRTASMKIRPVK